MKSSQPIGIFDSGIGGLTVANAIKEALPNENLVYFGDIAHLPYGDKSADSIRYYCIKISQFLLEHECKKIVIACNSAASAAYKVLIDFFKNENLFVSVVDPMVNCLTDKDYSKIGVIATKATVNSNAYKEKINMLFPSIEVQQLATPLLVPMIEEGFHTDKISDQIIEKYLSSDILKNIDALLLACTHYPLIKKNIDLFYQGSIDVVDSAVPVALEVKNQLKKENLLNNEGNPFYRFFVSDYTKSFEETTKLFYKENIILEEVSIW